MSSIRLHTQQQQQQYNKYIYELPHSVREEFCNRLDVLNVWKHLASITKLYLADVQKIKSELERGKSPTNEFLNIWGSIYNHTVRELFLVCYKCQLYDGMRLLRNYVEPKYRTLIPNTQQPLQACAVQNPAPTNECSAIENKLLNISTSNNITKCSKSAEIVREREQNLSDINNSSSVSEVLHDTPSILEINYDELTKATNNWNNENILGRGGFGIVYKGYWQHTDVAVKVMNYHRADGATNIKVELQQSKAELKYLISRRHPHILAIYGYSVKGDKPCLVYQLMKGGSLEQRIKAENCDLLTWQQRYNICRGTAAGISYLHTSREKALIHGDIKPDNILLDECLQPKIGDFGLARETLNAAVQVTQVYGTRFYLPPEYLKYKELSTAVDIYSFGVVLFETFTNKRAYDTNRKENLPAYIRKMFSTNTLEEILDARVEKPTSGKEFEMCNCILQEAMKCTSHQPTLRPEMDTVIKVFDAFRQSLSC